MGKRVGVEKSERAGRGSGVSAGQVDVAVTKAENK